MDPIQTGDVLTPSGGVPEPGLSWPAPPQPVYAVAVRVPDRNDEVKVSGALAKLCEEDPSLLVKHDAELGALVLWGQGDTHLTVLVERLRNRFKLNVETARPAISHREHLRRSAEHPPPQHKPSSGHGPFAAPTTT